MRRNIKSIGRIILFLVLLIYIVARMGMHSNQINTNFDKNSAEKPMNSNIPEGVRIASKYQRVVFCGTGYEVKIQLQLLNEQEGWIGVNQVSSASNCQYKTGFHISFVQDSLKVKLPLGTKLEEASCPLDCRYNSFFKHGVVSPLYIDTTINNIKYKILTFEDFEVFEI